MFFPLSKSIVACLDRASARKLLKVSPDEKTKNRKRELEKKEQDERLIPDEQTELMMLIVAVNFLADLQLEARGLLRRPAGSQQTEEKR